jgi:hypothetical protein
MQLDLLTKLLETIGKYAFAVCITFAFVIFVPNEFAESVGLQKLRRELLGELWLGFVFSTVLLLASQAKRVGALCWRYVVCPFLKILLPVRDARSCIKQSRMRYYAIQIRLRNGERYDVFQEVSSNGDVVRFMFEHGERFVPPEVYEGEIHGNMFVFPSGARIDWHDVFNGNRASGKWAISDPL